MPLKMPKSRSKKDIQSAVSANIRELKKSKHERPMKQIVAIALSSAKVKKK